MIKFSHSVFALPFALMAVFLASDAARRAGHALQARPSAVQLLLVVVCMVAARSVAMTFNRILDADIDARNPRTAGRALPAGTIRRGQAWAFLIGWAVVFVLGSGGFWWFMGNPWPILLAGPVLAYLCFYSYCKRFTRWSHFVLGSAIAISPVAAWLAIHPPSLGWPALLLMAAVTLWIAGFDLIYACQDIEVDRRDGLYSIPAAWGAGPALWLARLCHLLTVAFLVVLGIVLGLGTGYGVGLAAASVLLAVEHVLVRPADLSRIPVAFFHINALVSVILAGGTILDVLF